MLDLLVVSHEFLVSSSSPSYLFILHLDSFLQFSLGLFIVKLMHLILTGLGFFFFFFVFFSPQISICFFFPNSFEIMN
jgi:hypothetical protein